MHKSFTDTKALHTRLYTQTLLRIEACSQSRVYTEQLLHTEAFTQREAFAQSSLYNLIRTEALNTQMPKLLHRQVFTHKGSYTKVLHTDAADASTHRSFWTQMPFHTEAFTQRRFDIYTPMHAEAFRHRLFFRESQKLWHREAFTQRIFYTQKLLHKHKLFHRSFCTEKLLSTGALHTDALTHRSLYTEAFTHRSFYTEKPLRTDAFPQKNRFHRAAFTHFKKSQFYVSYWRSAIISCERVAPGVGKSQFLTLDNHFAYERVAPDLVKSQFLHQFFFARNRCVWRSKMDKVAILHQFLNVCIWR